MRQEAMNWWNNIPFEEKLVQIIKNKHHIIGYSDRSPDSLTGSEIELIFKNK